MDKVSYQGGDRLSVSVLDGTRLRSQLIATALKRSRNNFNVHAFAGTSDEAFVELEKSAPHVAVLSAQLADGHLAGFKVLHQLRSSNLKIPAAILLDSAERELVVDAFRAGARGVFWKVSDFESLPKCIRRIHEGQIWISNTELEFLLELIVSLRPFQCERTNTKPLLTRRERDIVRLVAEGMRNQEIAASLGLREHTVRNYVFRIFDKLGVSSRVELVLYALSRGESMADHFLPMDSPAKVMQPVSVPSVPRTTACRK